MRAMRERTFVARREGGWKRLDALLARLESGGLRALRPEELQELALLYRAMTSDLAAAQTREYSPELLAYLNRAIARAYVYVYGGSARSGWSRVAAFFAVEFPREVRRSGRILLATTALFVAAWIVAAWQVGRDPTNAYAFMSPEAIPAITKSLHDSNFAFDRATAPAVSSEIITNNIRVAMVAFAGGVVSLGVVTLWAILNNGLMVGGLAALYAQKGFGSDFYATIAPHGVIELTSIQIAGGAGLLMAQAVIAPGRLRRIDALKANARRAGVLMIGVAALLCVAGTIEAFVTPQRTTETFRFGVGAITAVALIAYFGLCGRTRRGATSHSR
ncbi:MAG: stage II sporulation protein M [Candidatus Eremiobacteraeota bacterium]|nr:stage II sporulation protein M [Candidatus Eremiobacteraeota bacterium]